jgi:hypothetical protein
MDLFKALNLGLAFFLEIFMLIAFVWGGFSFHVSTLVKVLVGIGAPLVVVILWSFFFAPTSDHRIPSPWLQLAIFTLYSIAAFVLAKGGNQHKALIFLSLGAVNLLLAIIWKQ